MLTDEQRDRYFERIGFTGPALPSAETLSALQQAHLRQVPYENLDIMAGIRLSVEPDPLYRKIVENRRGGYCFELNCLFSELLECLGFEVTSYLSRFLLDRPEPLPLRTHRVLKVHCPEGVFIADVGVYVECPREPLRLEEGLEQTDGFHTYRYGKDPLLGWVLYEESSDTGEWKKFYSFTEDPYYHTDFAVHSFYTETHPDSRFSKVPMVSIRTATGYRALYGNKLIVTGRGLSEKRELEKEALEDVLQKDFGLRYAL